MNKHLLILAAVIVAIALMFWKGGGDQPQRQAAAVAVRTDLVTPDTIASELNTLGTTEALLDVELTTERAGKVTAIHFDANQEVKAGELLVELASAVEKAAVTEAGVTLAEDRRMLNHYEKLFKTRAVPQTTLDEQKAKVAASEARLAAAEAALSELFIKAPFDGVLGFREVSPGTLIEPGDRITTLDAIDTLKLEFSAPEYWIGALKIGDKLTATSVAYPGKLFEAKVTAIANRLDPATRALVMKAKLDNSKHLLKPGMSLEVKLQGQDREALFISEESLVQEGSRRFVYLLTADNKVQQRDVTIGVRRQGKIEITSGLEAGDEIVREGVQKVRPGSQIAVLADGVAP